jgi:GMP synthase (glutamine-hydrolysing)
MELLIVKTGTTVDLARARTGGGDFEDWFRRGLELDAVAAPCIEVYREPDPLAALPDPRTVPAVIVTGSPSMVTDREPWSVATDAVAAGRDRALAARFSVSVTAIRLLADALGGRVGLNPRTAARSAPYRRSR